MNRRFPSIPLIVFAIGLTGCSGGSSGSESTPPPPPPATPEIYFAFGDSITYGLTLADPATQAYPYLVMTDENISPSDYADYGISGSQACDIPAQQIVPHQVNPAASPQTLSSLLVGTNDADVHGVGAYESVFKLCHQATIAWLGIPASSKIMATGSQVTTTGTVTPDSNPWNGLMTGSQGSTITFSFMMAQAGPVYLWLKFDDTSTGTYSYAIDGSTVGTGSSHTTPLMDTALNSTASMGLIRLPDIAAGAHQLTLTQTNQGSEGVEAIAMALPADLGTSQRPTVLVGTIPYQLQGSTAPCAVNDSICLEYIADIEADVDLFRGDGLDVRLFDTRQYFHGTAAEMNHKYHPNVLGQQELSKAVESVW